MSQGSIVKVSGPLVIAEGMKNTNMFDVVRVSKMGLIGEIIEMHEDKASIQVYEETAGLGPGEEVVSTGIPLSVELGPGLVKNMFDGIQRPLDKMYEMVGTNITRGINIKALDRDKKWNFVPCVQKGCHVVPGDIIGTVQETVVFTHKIMIPNGVNGTVKEIKSGEYTVEDYVATVENKDGEISEVKMYQTWPVRIGRPYKAKVTPDAPLITGQRNVDTMFPLAKGGVAAIPGPFGAGKTVVQHQLAKWSDADVVIYIGCGERGNEMTDVLMEFPQLKDPRTGESLMERTVLIANTSDMPVAAREASIYTGITIAEYFRDMGYNVALMADSTSRWAEALREMSGRLEEMPGEEGYPAYLGSRLAQFYERAGKVVCLGSEERIGSLSAIGAVSPPGGDISEPVSQATLRIVKVYWGLDSKLAQARHFPSINWLNSYSLYVDNLATWYTDNISSDWMTQRGEALRILTQEEKLNEIVRLVGADALPPQDRITIEVARSLREDFLQQDAMSDTDSFCPMEKQYGLLKLILTFDKLARKALENGADINTIFTVPSREKIARAKNSEGDYKAAYESITSQMTAELDELAKGEER